MAVTLRALAALGLALLLGLSVAFVAPTGAGAPRPGAASAAAGTPAGPAGAEAEGDGAAAAAPPDGKCCSTHTTHGMPNFKQCDKRWKCYPYAGKTGLSSCNTTACRDGGPANQTNNICGSGCGVTSSAMVLSYFGFAQTPPDVARWLLSEGFRDDLANVSGATCDGVSHTAICKTAEHWGKSCEESTSFDDLDRWLQAFTTPVIAHVRHRPLRKCKFTHAGHYVVITGRAADNSTYTVSDPNSCRESNTHGTRWELSVQCSLVGFVRMFDAYPGLYI